LTFSELVAHETALVTGPAGEDDVATAGVLLPLEAPEDVGLAVTVVVCVVGWLADDEQPATARQMSAAAEAAPENTALGNTGVPFVYAAPCAPSSKYDDGAGLPVGATPKVSQWGFTRAVTASLPIG
jgi:hypothetical protein